MRADRLVSLVLLLRRRGRLSAATLAAELEVSTRTVLRDIEALSAAGVPVYAERGRHGGFALLPGFATELTGLTHDEALALLVAGSRPGVRSLGLGSALAAALLKVVDALPAGHREAAAGAAERLLVDPATDLLARPRAAEEVPAAVLAAVRRAVLAGHRLRLHYAAVDRAPDWRTVDPIGLVTVRGQGYLLATRAGADRTYRLSRILAAEALAEPARRPDRVDLDRAWQDRSTRFRTGGDQVGVLVRVDPARRGELVGTALAVRAEETDADGRLRLAVTFQDARHAEWALWQLGPDAEALDPAWLRTALHARAATLAAGYGRPAGTLSAGPGAEAAMSVEREALAERVRAALPADRPRREVSMFGGRSFMVDGSMVVAARRGGELLVRVDPARSEELLAVPGAAPALMGDTPMGPGWLTVAPDGLGTDEQLAFWIAVGLDR